MQIQRHLEILTQLSRDGSAQISELSRRFEVSPNTIRRDLRRLEDEGLVIVTHGGAVSKQNLPMGLPLQKRHDQFRKEKERIGAKAAEFVQDGDAIIIDAGTTTERIVPALTDKREITVITNGMNIALGLVGKRGINTVLTGGVLNDVTICTAGLHAESFLAQFHVRTAFIGGGGITPEGVTNSNAFEVQMKRTMIECAEVVIFLATHEKIGKTSLAPFAALSDIDVVITDDKADSRCVHELEEHGVKVILC